MNAVAGSGEYRDWKSWDAGSFGKLDAVSRRYLDLELSTSGVALSSASKVLEIGFGNGSFATYCKNAGSSYTATEIDPELVERAREAGVEAIVAPDDLTTALPGRRFDLIACFDVLEHLTHDQIASMLTQFRTLLAPGGRVIARFPSGDSPFSMAMYNGDITHRSWIGRGAVLQFCLATGLKAEQIRHPAFPLTGVGAKRMIRRAPIAAVRWLTRTIVRTFFFDGQPRVVDPNMVIVLSKGAD